MMNVMLIENNQLQLRNVPEPVLKDGYVIIDVHAAGLNRADLLQVAGKYPPPPGWPEWPGLECAGVIAECAPGSRWKVGDRVCALLGGGGYAEKVLVPEGMVMPVPEGLSFIDAAALPEVYTTALLNVRRLGDLKKGETLFVQAGASGLGIAAIQLGKLLGAKIVTTIGSPEKAETVRQLGADVIINRKTESVEDVFSQHPVDVALDCAGGALLGKCLPFVNPGCRWILVATLGGETTEIPLRVLLKKHIHLMGSTLRSRSDAEKCELLKELTALLWTEISAGKIRPVIYKVFPFEEVKAAHEVMAQQKNAGKIILTLK